MKDPDFAEKLAELKRELKRTKNSLTHSLHDQQARTVNVPIDNQEDELTREEESRRRSQRELNEFLERNVQRDTKRLIYLERLIAFIENDLPARALPPVESLTRPVSPTDIVGPQAFAGEKD